MNAPDTDALLHILKTRFDKHMQRHQGLTWTEVEKKLADPPAALRSLAAMEETGGEPDVIGRDDSTGRLVFCDCSPETPAGRRSICFDRAALDARKEHKPRTSAMEMAAEMGIELLTEAQYRALQELGEFDRKTSSWVATPPDIRALGGALFCDRRYGKVFVYHNGAESYYAVRGFRGWLAV
ncbi:DUF4256 domain-containing protein [Massilia agri]|uniref:DUF4256 domain-containing protein n=1 Tax=Massilia agri TaxID=1886785 RepID=A0ABT2AHW9_9BURK|nr:DUF4256 domain-containing protein [Massilia agri]MCS0595756.1 DUF4256 domain-containing protein [Massilia agri]